MKPILLGVAILLVIALLTACETTADGTTRFDSAAFREVVTTGERLYDRYNAPAQPMPAPQPVYYAQPQPYP